MSELYHWGIMGMKWGHRRYQNPDGTLTPAGRKRYKKSAREMTDDELVSAIERLTKEKRYTDLVKEIDPPKPKKDFKSVLKAAGKQMEWPASLAKYGLEKVIKSAIDRKVADIGKTESEKETARLKKYNALKTEQLNELKNNHLYKEYESGNFKNSGNVDIEKLSEEVAKYMRENP